MSGGAPIGADPVTGDDPCRDGHRGATEADPRGDSWPESDAQGIYLCRVCDRCERYRLAGFRPEILTGYNQADVDEPIEPDDYGGGFERTEDPFSPV